MNYFGLVLSFLLPLVFFLVWLLLVFNFWRSRILGLIPPPVRQYLKDRLKVEYQPYQPAIRSLKSLLRQMIKIAVFVFFTALLILMIIYGPAIISWLLGVYF